MFVEITGEDQSFVQMTGSVPMEFQVITLDKKNHAAIHLQDIVKKITYGIPDHYSRQKQNKLWFRQIIRGT
jgi:hypothetical protein